MKSKNIFYFALGRNAMFAVCKILNLQKDDEVLTPAWDCDGALEAFRAISCKIVFYKVDQFSQRISIEHIKSLMTPKTKLIHIINYFGIPQPWEEILKFREETNIPILEDNAYSLPIFLNGSSGGIGSFGDFSIFSIRKTFHLPDGGILKINNGMEYIEPEKTRKWIYPPEYGRIKDFCIGFIKKIFGLSRISLSNFFVKDKKPSRYFPPLYDSEITKIPEWKRGGISTEFTYDFERPISKLSNLLFSTYSESKLKKIAEKKIIHYNYLSHELSQIKKLIVLNPFLPTDTVPESISVVIENNRDKILEFLQKKKYSVMAWPTLPLELLPVIKKYAEIEYLGKKIIQINLNSNTKIEEYESLVNEIKLLLWE